MALKPQEYPDQIISRLIDAPVEGVRGHEKFQDIAKAIRDGKGREWDAYAKKLPAALRALQAEFLSECRRNGFYLAEVYFSQTKKLYGFRWWQAMENRTNLPKRIEDTYCERCERKGCTYKDDKGVHYDEIKRCWSGKKTS